MNKLKAFFTYIYTFIHEIFHNMRLRKLPFTGSDNYWNKRYETGGSSGLGSHYHLAQYKAEIINSFVNKYKIKSIIEFGCGDGNQLKLARYPSYKGYDISKDALSLCEKLFVNDNSKSFRLMDEYNGEKADLTLSLDVIFHLIEVDIYENYLERLFDASSKYVIIYSSNIDRMKDYKTPHIKHRKFTNWIEKNRPSWKLIKRIPNQFPQKCNFLIGSFSEFYIYQNINYFNQTNL